MIGEGLLCFFVLSQLQSFRSLPQKPLSVDLTVEEGQRLKVIYGSLSGFHAIDVDSGTPYDLYLPTHVRIFLCIHTPTAAHCEQNSKKKKNDHFIFFNTSVSIL